MVVFGDGTFTGTIGGGTLEWRAIAEAQRLIGARVKVSQAADADLSTGYSARSYALGPELGQCCGGHVNLGYEWIDPGSIEAVRLFADQEGGGTLLLASEIDRDRMKRRAISTPAQLRPGETLETFGEPVRTLVLFGAGHVGRAVVLALAALPFRVIWVDARPDAFPSAVPGNVSLVRPEDPVKIVREAPAGSFILIMTHSHELDLALCDAALRSGAFPYVGLIGSATKRARFERRLIAAGILPERVAGLVCPIGDLGPKSKLPQVIAATTVVELLVKDEQCLKVAGSDGIADGSAEKLISAGTAGRGQSSGG
jgi:xanthine dehydrogenase accessory factor